MKIVNSSYNTNPGFDRPVDWLQRIAASTGILEQLGKQHEVISIEQIHFEGRYIQNDVQYCFLDTGKKPSCFPFRVNRFIKEQQPDIVLVNGFIFPLQLIQLRWHLGKKIKIIAQHHAEKPFTGWKKWLQRAAGHCIDAYLFASRETGLEWIRKGNLPREEAIHEVMEASSAFSPMDQTRARSITGVEGHPVFLWVGRLDSNKDPLTVLQAFLQLLKRYPSVRLYMIYHSEELLEAVRSLLREQDAGNHVVLIGKLPHRRMQYWFSSADFIVSGSHYEGSGIAVCEAMSCGCIPIVTDIPSFRKMTGGRCGFLYPAGNTAALLSTMDRAVKMPVDKESKKVLQQFRDELSFEAIAAKIGKLVADLTKAPADPQ